MSISMGTTSGRLALHRKACGELLGTVLWNAKSDACVSQNPDFRQETLSLGAMLRHGATHINDRKPMHYIDLQSSPAMHHNRGSPAGR